jgi:hypothetical protein
MRVARAHLFLLLAPYRARDPLGRRLRSGNPQREVQEADRAFHNARLLRHPAACGHWFRVPLKERSLRCGKNCIVPANRLFQQNRHETDVLQRPLTPLLGNEPTRLGHC